MDGIRYIRVDTEHSELVDSVLEMCRVKFQQFFLVWRRIRFEPDDGNRKVVKFFGHIHLSYAVVEEDSIQLDLVHIVHVCPPCIITVLYDYRRQLPVWAGIR